MRFATHSDCLSFKKTPDPLSSLSPDTLLATVMTGIPVSQ